MVRIRCLITTGDGGPPQGLMDRLSAVGGVLQIEWWQSLVVPQPEEVRNDLNAYTGVLDVFSEEIELVTGAILPHLEDAHAGELAIPAAIISDASPEYDLLRETPPQHIPYLDQPIAWKHGHGPQRREPTGDDLVRYTYFFRYREDVSWEDGEDWYIGHHTREGKMLPNLVHYVTWHRRPTIASASPLLGTQRVTELCFERFEDFYDSCYRLGPAWNMGTKHESVVWTGYHATFLGLEPSIVIEVE